MTATQLSKTTLFSQSYENLKAIVDDRSIVADPVSGTNAYRKMVYTRRPDVKESGFQGYPYIVLPAPTLDQGISGDGQTLDRKTKNLEWTFNVEIVSSDRGFNNENGKGLSHMNTLSDSLAAALNNVTHRNTLKDNLFYDITVDASGVDTETEHNKLVFVRAFRVTMRSRIQVSG